MICRINSFCSYINNFSVLVLSWFIFSFLSKSFAALLVLCQVDFFLFKIIILRFFDIGSCNFNPLCRRWASLIFGNDAHHYITSFSVIVSFLVHPKDEIIHFDFFTSFSNSRIFSVTTYLTFFCIILIPLL